MGGSVVVDAVNPVLAAREGWRRAADGAGVALRYVEVVCSDAAEHRRRVEGRVGEVAAFPAPTWHQVTSRLYEPWGADLPRLVVDNLGPPDPHVEEIVRYLAG